MGACALTGPRGSEARQGTLELLPVRVTTSQPVTIEQELAVLKAEFKALVKLKADVRATLVSIGAGGGVGGFLLAALVIWLNRGTRKHAYKEGRTRRLLALGVTERDACLDQRERIRERLEREAK